MVKVKLSLISGVFVLVLILVSGCQKPAAKHEVYFFYMEICPGCESYKTAKNLSSAVVRIVKKNKSITGEALNIIDAGDSDCMMEILKKKNLTRISYAVPLLIVDDTYFVGYEEISEKLTELENSVHG